MGEVSMIGVRGSVFVARLGAMLLGLGMMCIGLSVASRAESAIPAGFVKADGTRFVLNGKTFPVAGVNNHYLSYATPGEVLGVLDDAKALGANVIRTHNHPVIGSPKRGGMRTIWDWRARAEASNLGVHGVYMLYWDDARGKMAINEGPNGMERLDFLLAEARKRGIRVILPFLDFWAYTGGAQQMRAWYGSEDKYTFFFTDERTRADFKRWIKYLMTRVNKLTGVAYKDDPTIFAWELMNEPNARPESVYLAWVREMSHYAKSISSNHLIAVGHAGISNRLSEAPIETIDFLTWHGYPLFYKLTVDQFDDLIGKQCEIGRKHGKPVLLEEFGYARSNPDQLQAYEKWLRTIEGNPECAGWVVWRLVSRQVHGKYPVDNHDQFDFHRHSGGLWDVIKAGIERMKARQ